MRIALGPVLYYWSRDRLLEFYRKAEGLPVDVVYLGETVCSKRRSLRLEDWVELGERLAATGKQVVLSTLTLVEAGSELASLRRVCDTRRFLVEANDYAAVERLSGGGVEFVAGPTMNIYNDRTLRVLHDCGMRRWVPPVEMPRETVAAMAAAAAALSPAVETEVFGYGRMPLAFSARCFTARAANRPKDDCGFLCGEDPEGRPLLTRDGELFLTINGIQTQSGRRCNLLPHWRDLAACGVDLLRISPVPDGTAERIRRLRAALDAADGDGIDPGLVEPDTVDGYWWGKAGLDSSMAERSSS